MQEPGRLPRIALFHFFLVAIADLDGQKMLSAAHSNFSIFGLSFIFAAGGLIILASWLLESLVACIQRRRKLDSYARLEWCANETLQLQRLAHEELGMGTWSSCDGEVPVTERGERLAVLDLTDSKHPKLKARPMGWEEITAPAPTRSRETVMDDEGRSTQRDDSSYEGGCEVVSPVGSSAPGSVDGSTLAEIAYVPMSLDDRHTGNCKLDDERDAAREGM